MANTLSKDERLSNLNLIRKLFREGKTWVEYPFKVTWMIHPETDVTPVKVLFSVPRQTFRNASTRNLLRRRMREGYRLHKHILTGSHLPAGQNMIICLRYMSRSILPSSRIHEKIILTLKRLKVKHEAVTG